MQRRRFLQFLSLAGAGTFAAIEIPHAHAATRTVTFGVQGFTCPTCAVGLETMLRQQKGVRWAEASYPDARVVIRYNPASVTEADLKGFIAELGFTASAQPS